MKIADTDELRLFSQFVVEKVKDGDASLSPEETLDEWRTLHPDPEFDALEVEAIRDMENGDLGRNANQVMAELRAEFGLDK